jgi:hypothetical protein
MEQGEKGIEDSRRIRVQIRGGGQVATNSRELGTRDVGTGSCLKSTISNKKEKSCPTSEKGVGPIEIR